MTARRWVLITGEYPPQPGGVSDHCAILARMLAERGDVVEVWTSACLDRGPSGSPLVKVRELPGRFGVRALVRLKAWLAALSDDTIIVLHYVPQAFGWRGANVAFCWLIARRRSAQLWTLFHELYMPLGWGVPLRHQLLGLVQRFMVVMLLHASRQILVAIPRWGVLLKPWIKRQINPILATIPSNILPGPGHLAATELWPDGRPEGPIVGHFGTFGAPIAAALRTVAPLILATPPYPSLLLIGYGAAGFATTLREQLGPKLAARIYTTQATSNDDVVALISACDVMVQPFPDGITTRRSSVMASLSLGKAVVSTNGLLSDPLWQECGGVALVPVADPVAMAGAVAALLRDPDSRTDLGRKALQLYQSRFSWEHFLEVLVGLAA